MKENLFVPPEEGDLNTSAISQGLTPEGEKRLRQDLGEVESGTSGRKELLDSQNDSPSEFWRSQQSHDRQQQDEQVADDLEHNQFEEFIRAKGVLEEDISFADLGAYLFNGGTGTRSFAGKTERDAFLKRLEDLEREWHES